MRFWNNYRMDISKQEPEGILLITGTVGTGKTTVVVEIGEQLTDMGLPNAVIDLDWLGWVNAGDNFQEYDQLIMQNLITVWPNYRAIGVAYLVLARGFIHREPVDMLKSSFSNTPITIIRLMPSKETIERRLSQRDSGETLREHLEEMSKFSQLMDELHLEDTSINNDDLSVEETAQQSINFTGWKRSRD